jgi:enoyl-CoA hydratase/carnithine racemase
MKLSIKLGEFNKPIFAKVHGSARGIAAYILTMFSTPLGTDRSSLRLDETAKGFIPIFGGSHKLSRLPCNIGIYLALTGDRLDAD